jgi:small nuclear ribonucleoprotein (snRNP)-like protein
MQANQENGESQSGTPQAFLNSVVGQPVWVRLNSGVDYKGIGHGTLLCANVVVLSDL